MRALAARAAKDRHVVVAVEQRREPLKIGRRGRDDGPSRQQAADLGGRRIGRGLQRDIARYHHHRHAALADRLADGDFQRARHLLGFGDQLAIVAAFLEKHFRVRLLEIPGADLRRRYLRRDRQHRHARPVAIEQAVDQMQIAGSAAPGADRELARQMRFGARCKSGDLLMPDMNPLDFGLPAERVGQAVQAVADDAIDPLDARRSQNLRELIRYGFRHVFFSIEQMPTSFGDDDVLEKDLPRQRHGQIKRRLPGVGSLVVPWLP